MNRLVILIVTLLLVISSAASDDVSHLDLTPDLSREQVGGDFTLYSSQGRFSLQQLRGKVVLLYFGYTKCPDVCPTSLALMTQALNELSADELKSVQGVFVSVDPERDTFQILNEYVSYFHPNIMGVTGSLSEIDEVAKRYGVKYSKVELEESVLGYAVDHSAITYLLTPKGELRYVFPHQTPSFVILEAIRYILGDER
jgi:protein SCO1/2